MSETVQNFKNHARLDPKYHFFLLPAAFAAFVWAVMHLVRVPNGFSLLIALMAFLLLFGVFVMRTYALKVQDRLIRLEERLRLSALGVNAAGLTEGQLIALRFASDEEAASLAVKALQENLGSKQIKAAIQKWRPDYFRV